MPSDSALLTDSNIYQAASTNKEEGKPRNSSADTEATKPKPPESQGDSRKNNKFTIGAPSNYDKIKSIRELKNKDKGLTKMVQPPEPVCNFPFKPRRIRDIF